MKMWKNSSQLQNTTNTTRVHTFPLIKWFRCVVYFRYKGMMKQSTKHKKWTPVVVLKHLMYISTTNWRWACKFHGPVGGVGYRTIFTKAISFMRCENNNGYSVFVSFNCHHFFPAFLRLLFVDKCPLLLTMLAKTVKDTKAPFSSLLSDVNYRQLNCGHTPVKN